MTIQSPQSFESFNARALRPSLVAKTFVPSVQFDVLTKRRHSIIVGPRGSGKTTLLKMLQQSALESWDHSAAPGYATRIDYTGVFIASDLSWGAQINAIGKGKLNDTDAHHLLGAAAFTTHILKALVTAMISRITPVSKELGVRQFRRVAMSNLLEARVAEGIATSWKLSLELPSLLSIKHALGSRLSDLREFGNREVILGPEGRTERLANNAALHMHFLQSVLAATEIFDDAANDEGGRWALLFDELELSPKWIREELIRSLRGADERILFKLALSPYSEEFDLSFGAHGAAQGQDFDFISLYYAQRHESRQFANDLWFGLIRDRGLDPVAPEEALGQSSFSTHPDEYAPEQTVYRPGSRIGKTFGRLAASDQSFRNYLKQKGISLDLLQEVTSLQRAADLRKIGPLVTLREFYRAPDRLRDGIRHRTSRSRKSAALFTGADSIFAITEGNPRIFIGLIGAILDRWSDRHHPLPQRIQADAIERTAERFGAFLRTIPLPAEAALHSSRGLLSLLSTIGRYFHAAVVERDFVAEPVGTFVVDSTVSSSTLMAIGIALNAGAIVYVHEEGTSPMLVSLRGKRFRLSYLLSPQYGLPIRLGKPLSLGKILANPADSSNISLSL